MPSGLILRASNRRKSTLGRVSTQERQTTEILAHFGLMLVGTWTDSIRESLEPILVYDNLLDLVE
jgi:hypothetical protein